MEETLRTCTRDESATGIPTQVVVSTTVRLVWAADPRVAWRTLRREVSVETVQNQRLVAKVWRARSTDMSWGTRRVMTWVNELTARILPYMVAI